MMGDWSGKRVVILGLARQGTALARYLVAQGARVTISDMKPEAALAGEVESLRGAAVRFALGGHPLSLLDECDMLCLSGGVPIDLPIVLEARRRGIALSNDSQIFFEVCPAPIIGITGSAGKTTTTTLVGEILKEDGRRKTEDGSRPVRVEAQRQSSVALARPPSVWVGGNIGNPLIADVDQIQPRDFVVMELSSFQLELMTRSPHIACITNITPNHLDRHGTMEAYAAAKRHIVDYQGADDWAVLCFDDDMTRALDGLAAQTVWFGLSHRPHGDGAWLDEFGTLRVRVRIGARGLDERVCHERDLLLMGRHNVLNVLAACAVTGLAGASVESMRAVATTFKGVEHRLQLVREVNGVRYYDGSISTAPERLMADLRCFTQPVVLLCGGRDKHLPWQEAVQVMAQRCKHTVLFGEMAPMVAREIEQSKLCVPATVCDTLEHAVGTAAARAQPGDVVVLSPGGTSFDAFKDFAARGDQFVQLVREIGEGPTGRGGE